LFYFFEKKKGKVSLQKKKEEEKSCFILLNFFRWLNKEQKKKERRNYFERRKKEERKMPTMTQYLAFAFVNLGFVAQIAVMMYMKSALEIQKNWPLYRCNPPYWVFSKNISEDFIYCVQNTQTNMMDFLLQPMNYMVTSLASVGGGLGDGINDIRNMFASVRTFITDIVQNVFGVFFNIIIEFQKLIISIQDMVAKMVGIVVVIMNVLDGSIKTMNSSWKGPPGQMIQAIGSCFHPDTLITLKDGSRKKIKDVQSGTELVNGNVVHATMKIANLNNEPFFKLTTKENKQDVYVTGSHYIFDNMRHKWMQVATCNEEHKELTDWVCPELVSLITTKGCIEIDNLLFADWEDDHCCTQIK
jgi:hypothetical protein